MPKKRKSRRCNSRKSISSRLNIDPLLVSDFGSGGIISEELTRQLVQDTQKFENKYNTIQTQAEAVTETKKAPVITPATTAPTVATITDKKKLDLVVPVLDTNNVNHNDKNNITTSKTVHQSNDKNINKTSQIQHQQNKNINAENEKEAQENKAINVNDTINVNDR
eukprot:CAMPEP_0202455802 /NCGR_PEP_ID=MMETSP1360-20130828/13239_1 /ASSEMBLY_ACC=CAM_ASM_000848 /TAXON_ID=515479 /ORGANISM="Licmophora paradoxa, Strain CCMP2313" /LENGTH=165 /DNA_ID=CAMNT_0049075463 /DNA_START=18 /DNA_END=511 /DNA_ORIENTATION=-